MLLGLTAHFEDLTPDGERRRSHRRALKLGASAATEPVTILNLSERGMLVESSTPMLIGTTFTVVLPSVGSLTAEVIWNRGQFYGCEFDQRLSRGALSALILLGSGDAGSN